MRVFKKAIYIVFSGFIWQTFKSAMIPKPGKDPRIPLNYRPNSLLSCIGWFSQLTRIVTHIDEYNLMGQEQFGFCQQYSTVHQLERVTNSDQRNKANRTTIRLWHPLAWRCKSALNKMHILHTSLSHKNHPIIHNGSKIQSSGWWWLPQPHDRHCYFF